MFVDVPADIPQPPRNLFREARDGGYMIRNEQAEPYMIQVTAFKVGLLDLTNPAARTWMKSVIREEMIQRAGCSGWMADFAEALPFDAVLYSGESATSFHNQYPVEWIRLHREAVEEHGTLGKTLIFNRSGHTRSPKHAMLLWEGDQLTTWDEYDGLVSALHGLINGGLSGITLNHSDTGGYTSLSKLCLGYSREAEQLKRWTEMNAFTAVLRTHEGNQPGANAQVYSDSESMAHFARFTKVYKALKFYREELMQQASARGWPLVRHLMLHYPDDEQAHMVGDQFLLGSELLVAPILNKCWTWPSCSYDKEVYFPKGEWVHVWTGKVYGSNSGGAKDIVPSPIGEPAAFYRRGSSVGAQFAKNLRAAGIQAPDPS
jgi:alpha-glucosidase